MKKLLILAILLCSGCSSNKLICEKTNYSTIYGNQVIKQEYEFKNDKFINYSLIKNINFDDNMKDYIDTVFDYYEKEAKITDEKIKNSVSSVQKDMSKVSITTIIDIKNSDNSIKLLNISKNNSLDYIKSNLTEIGYSCTESN